MLYEWLLRRYLRRSIVVEVGVGTQRTVVGGNLLEVGVHNPEGDIVLEAVDRMELLEEDIVLEEDTRFDYMVVVVEEEEVDIPVDLEEGIVVHKRVVLHTVLLVEVEDILEGANMTLIAQLLMKTHVEDRL